MAKANKAQGRLPPRATGVQPTPTFRCPTCRKHLPQPAWHCQGCGLHHPKNTAQCPEAS